jgi:CHAT domain-containing protein
MQQAATLFTMLLYALPSVAMGWATASPAELEARAQQHWLDHRPAEAAALLCRALDAYHASGQAAHWIKAHKNAARLYRDQLDNPLQAEHWLQRALAYPAHFAPACLDREAWQEAAWAHVNLAYLYAYYLDRRSAALEHYQAAARVFREQLQQEDLQVAAYVYREWGNLYAQAGDYKAAEVTLSKAEKIALDYGDNDLAAQLASDLGTAAFWSGQSERANGHYRAGLALPGISAISEALLLANQAKVLNQLGQYRQAHDSARRAKDLYQTAVEQWGLAYLQSNIPACMELMAESLLLQEQYAASEKLLTQAAAHYRALQGQAATRKLAKCYYALGGLYLAWGKHQAGLASHQKALQVLLPAARLDSWQQNPDPALFYAENTIMDALAGKAAILYAWHQQSPNAAKLEIALQCHELIFAVEQLLRRTHYYESSKLFNVAEARTRSGHAIAIALELWRLSQDERYKEQALAFAERSKSTLLLEAFYKSKAEAGAGLPRFLLDTEQELQGKIATLESQLFAARAAGAPQAEQQALDREMLELRQAYALWVNKIEREYPDYYRLKYDVQTPNSAQIRRQLLAKGQAFVEYFVAEKEIYAFVISQDQFEVLAWEKDFPLEAWVAQFRQSIEGFSPRGADWGERCEAYGELGLALYQRLIAPLEGLGLPGQLLIVPSGALGFLPFDALLTSPPPAGCHFGRYPYLIRRYAISQAYSAALQAALLERPSGNRRLAGFAPAFPAGGPYAPLDNLAFMEEICRLNGGEAFLGDQANRAALLAEGARFGLLHFASHAQANPQEGDFSFILLADGQGGYDSFFVKDIYLLPLQAEMAVLSACETAVGTLYQGEGIISLARAFLYAGANSVVTTLWPINEQANNVLMQDFYGFLQQGHDKSAALRLAQLQQIERGGRGEAHPFYWAGFTPIGNMRPVYRASWPLWAVALGIVLLALGLTQIALAYGNSLNVASTSTSASLKAKAAAI